MSATQLQELLAQVQQLTLVNTKLQEELSNNCNHIARLESAMSQRRSQYQEGGQNIWSRSSSLHSSKSSEENQISSAGQTNQTPNPKKLSSTGPSLQAADQRGSMTSGNSLSSGSAVTQIRREFSNESDVGGASGGGDSQARERRDSGCCDHAETENDGVIYRDVMTNTPYTSNMLFRQVPGLEDLPCPIVISSDRHGNELVTIATQTSEVVMPSNDSNENVRGCAKAQQLATFYHGAWPLTDADVGADNMHSGPETQSVMSFHSSISSHSSRPSNHNRDKDRSTNHSLAQQVIAESEALAIEPQALMGNPPLGSKVQMVYSLLAMLGTHDPEDMAQTLLAMSSSTDSCVALRQSGCLPLLVQLIYGSEGEKEVMVAGRICRATACKALHNIIHCPTDEKRYRKETKILKYLEIIQAHCERIREDDIDDITSITAAEAIWPPDDLDVSPGPAVAALMKLSFDDHSRQQICALGGLQCMSQLIKFDQSSYGASSDINRVTMRRYACMTLTNLTYGDSNNKARLCAMQGCLDAIVLQLQSFNEDLCQVAASVVRNLSWRADNDSKSHLRVSKAASKLMITALQVTKESTLKSILSALWNLSAHCTQNKMSICEVDGAIQFLVTMLNYKSPSKTLAIVECAGGILRNISSVIAVRDDYRQILRDHHAFEILLSHLRSPSLVVVGNACGALWNISARCPADQKTLLVLGAIPQLKNLTTSKHRLISMGSSATIKNLTTFKSEGGKATNKSQSHTSSTSSAGAVGGKKTRRDSASSPIKSRHTSLDESDDYMQGVHRTDSQDSVGSCSSLTSQTQNEGQATLSKIEQIMQQVIQTSMEIHQCKKPAGTSNSSSIHHSLDRLNVAATSSRGKSNAVSSAASGGNNYQLMARSTEYNSHSASGSNGSLTAVGQSAAFRSITNNSTLSPRVTSKHVHNQNTSSAVEDRYNRHLSQGGSAVDYTEAEDDSSPPTNFSMTYNDDNIDDNSSEKPVDYSQRYQESIAGYDISNSHSAANLATAMLPLTSGSRQLTYSDSHIPAAFLHHDPALLLQPNLATGFMDHTSFSLDFNIPTLDQIRAQAMSDFGGSSTSSRPSSIPSTRASNMGVNRPVPNLSQLASMEDHQGDDQVKTFYTEGTPMNFLSTATSMNELHRIGLLDDLSSPLPEDDRSVRSTATSASRSQATQDSVKSNSAFKSKNSAEVGAAPPSNSKTSQENPILKAQQRPPPEQEELLRTYATEDTPLTGLSRISSLSSLTSAVDGKSLFNGSEAPTRPSETVPTSLQPTTGLERIQENEILSPKQASTHNRSHNKSISETKTVSFDDHAHVQETPMMFSRASSLASLESFDQHSVHSSVFSDYSRRASQVVSPSDLPDSPGGTTPHSPRTARKNQQAKRQEQPLTPPLDKMPTSVDIPTTSQTPASVSQAFNSSSQQSNLAGMNQFGSLSGLTSLLGPEVDTSANQEYADRLLAQYGDNPYRGQAANILPTSSHQSTPVAPVQPIQSHQQKPSVSVVRPVIQQPTNPVRPITPVSNQTRIPGPLANQGSPAHSTPYQVRQTQGLPGPSLSASTSSMNRPKLQTPSQIRPSASVDILMAASSVSKVNQYLSDTVRTYAVEGTPGPNSSRSSLSALTFLDEPDMVLGGSQNLLKSTLSKSKESIISSSKQAANQAKSQMPTEATKNKDEQEKINPLVKTEKESTELNRQEIPKPADNIKSGTVEYSPSKPLDLSTKKAVKQEVKTEPIQDTDEAPPLPPKPSHLARTKATPPNVEKSPSVNLALDIDNTTDNDKSPGANNTTQRSRTSSEARLESDSSLSDGDDMMLQKCISSAIPISKNKKVTKSSSDGTVSSAATNRSANTRSGPPRSKTFGSKLRIPSKRSLKAAQLAKRQTPPIVSANSPTPDDDYFAEDTVRAYCTEDTPYNKSTATSLSDLSVIDDDDINLSNKSCSDSGDRSKDSNESSSPSAGKKTGRRDSQTSSCDSSSDSDSDDASSNMLSNAILSAIPKKPQAKPIQLVTPDPRPKPTNPVAGVGAGSAPPDSSSMLKLTSNELRATDIKYQTSADSIRNYATEGTPHNFSTNTSLSDLTIESHYTSSAHPTKLPATLGNQQAKASASVKPLTASKPLLHKRQVLGQQSQNSPQAASSPFAVRGAAAATPSKKPEVKPGSQSTASATPSFETRDEFKSYGIEGTPFNYSRRESLSSLSCDDSEEDEVNITIINRVNEAVLKKSSMKTPTTTSVPHASTSAAVCASATSTTVVMTTTQTPSKQTRPLDSALMLPPPQPSSGRLVPGDANNSRVAHVAGASITVQDGLVKNVTIQPPADGFQSRDEVMKYTPIEGTPYCFSRNSPLSSLSGSDLDSDGEEGAPVDANKKPPIKAVMSSIDAAHQAEGGGSLSDSTDSDSDVSQESKASRHAFLDHCISSAIPKKTATLPRPTQQSTEPTTQNKSAAQTKAVTGASAATTVSTSARNTSSTQVVGERRVPPSVAPKPSAVKPPAVNLLPTTGELVVSQRSLTSSMVSQGSDKSASASSNSKQSQQKNNPKRELRRRTYTVTESELQSALALISIDTIPVVISTHPTLYKPVETEPTFSSSPEPESNIEISGDEDDFDDVFHVEDEELFKQDINAIIDAIRQATNQPATAEHSNTSNLKVNKSLYTGQGHSDSDEELPTDAVRVEPIGSSGDSPVSPDDATIQSKKIPRIVKPVSQKPQKPQDEEQKGNQKVIRGKRKPLYTTNSLATAGKPNSPTAKVSNIKRMRQTSTNTHSKVKKTSRPTAAAAAAKSLADSDAGTSKIAKPITKPSTTVASKKHEKEEMQPQENGSSIKSTVCSQEVKADPMLTSQANNSDSKANGPKSKLPSRSVLHRAAVLRSTIMAYQTKAASKAAALAVTAAVSTVQHGPVESPVKDEVPNMKYNRQPATSLPTTSESSKQNQENSGNANTPSGGSNKPLRPATSKLQTNTPGSATVKPKLQAVSKVAQLWKKPNSANSNNNNSKSGSTTPTASNTKTRGRSVSISSQSDCSSVKSFSSTVKSASTSRLSTTQAPNKKISNSSKKKTAATKSKEKTPTTSVQADHIQPLMFRLNQNTEKSEDSNPMEQGSKNGQPLSSGNTMEEFDQETINTFNAHNVKPDVVSQYNTTITVQMDVNPSLTITEAKPQEKQNQHKVSEERISPPTESSSHVNHEEPSEKCHPPAAPTAPLTKTEMLLKRRNELLNKQALSSGKRTSQKCTDV